MLVAILTITTTVTHLQLATKTDLDRRLAGNLRREHVVTRAKVIALQPKITTAVIVDPPTTRLFLHITFLTYCCFIVHIECPFHFVVHIVLVFVVLLHVLSM
jgi:hypothetical protein